MLFMPIMENLFAVAGSDSYYLLGATLCVGVPFFLVSLRLARVGGDVLCINSRSGSWLNWSFDATAERSWYFAINSKALTSIVSFDFVQVWMELAMVAAGNFFGEESWHFAAFLTGTGTVSLLSALFIPPYQRTNANSLRTGLAAAVMASNFAAFHAAFYVTSFPPVETFLGMLFSSIFVGMLLFKAKVACFPSS